MPVILRELLTEVGAKFVYLWPLKPDEPNIRTKPIMRKTLLSAAFAALAAFGLQAQDAEWEAWGTADAQWDTANSTWPSVQPAQVNDRDAYRRYLADEGVTEYRIVDAWGREGYDLILTVGDDGLVGAKVGQIGLSTGYGPVMFADRYTHALYNVDHGNPLDLSEQTVEYYRGYSAFYPDEGRFVIDGVYFADYDAGDGIALGTYARGKEIITLKGAQYKNYNIDLDDAAWRTDDDGKAWMDVTLQKNDCSKVRLLALKGAPSTEARAVFIEMEYGEMYSDQIVTALHDGTVSLPIEDIEEGSPYTVYALWYNAAGEQIDAGYVDFVCTLATIIQTTDFTQKGQAVYYDLTGRLCQPQAGGVYVKVQDGKAVKVRL